MAGYEERGVRARVAAHCAQLAGYRRSLYDREPYDTDPIRYGTYTMWNLYGYAAMQLCSVVLLKTAMQRYAEHAALCGCNEYTTCSAATQPSHLQHVTPPATNISLGFAGTGSIRCPRGCARESPRAGRRTRPPGDTSGSRKLLKLEVLQHTSIVLRTLLYRSMNEQTFEKLKYNKVGPCQNII